ncbi:amidohydrolase [Catenulispora acidiphila DSM 44928]|uniref:Amidohydrolase n=1 Tax=Catenulispora acidiphila (strain DSM 44928 / JCM 14897 / NBRC 102108 / NRRL B-24433 / ID139908) TaxID=479433 RepID=C7QH29_CATAD|nr:amidohydrolase family protein [Catenulispora acidiphila]ACU76879.1 amidohydrolase [Catenulispora acidiphila DSM 44928]
MLTLHAAPLVLPMTAAPIPDGAVVVDNDRVVAVGTRADLVAAHPEARVREWPGVITPGLVNSHAHTQYYDFGDLASSGLPFPEWLHQMVARRATFTDAMWQESTRRGLHAYLKTGTTAVADIVTEPAVLSAIARSGIRGVAYIEAVFADDASWAAGKRADLVTAVDGSGGPVRGVSPHTPFTISTGVYEDCVTIAHERGKRLHPHIAETMQESEYVLTGTGPFADNAKQFGLDFSDILDHGTGLTPVEWADARGALGDDCHIAHGIHVSASDRALLRERGTAVALCVRSNRILEAGEPPVAAYLEEGSPIGIGTDSAASSPSLDLLEEARALRAVARNQGYTAEDLDRRIVEAATLGGAAALGLTEGPDRVGRLEPGVRADFAVFSVADGSGDSSTDGDADGDPYKRLIDRGACVATVLAGKIVHRTV